MTKEVSSINIKIFYEYFPMINKTNTDDEYEEYHVDERKVNCMRDTDVMVFIILH